MKTQVSISPRVALALVATAAYLFEPVVAHSWVEALMRVAPNGTMVGPTGYPRGYQPRNAPGRVSDDNDVWLLPPNGVPNKITAQMNMCRPGQRSRSMYSSSAPMLKAAPGDFLALRYQENGHVTLPDTNPTKPTNRGTIYIYGTTTPSDDEKFEDVWMSWTPDGNGGNGKGRLLATRNFDDGQCYQVNGQKISQTRQKSFSKKAMDPMGADLWCQNDIQLPADAQPGKPYTLYWVWHWPSFNVANQASDMPTGNAKIVTEQFYTSCFDVDVSGAGQVAPTSKAAMHFAKFDSSQDRNNAAILGQLTGGAFQAAGSSGGGGGGKPGNGGSTNGAAKSLQPGVVASSSNAATAQPSGFKTVTVTQSVATVTVTMQGNPPSSAAAAAATVAPASFSARPVSQAAASIASASASIAAQSSSAAAAAAAAGPTFTVAPFLPV